MKNAIILHGMPSKESYYSAENKAMSEAHWFGWIKKQLSINNVLTQTPEFPHPYIPNYNEWKKVFEYFPVNEESILVGHSCGAGFLIRYLSENKINISKAILVAPWLNTEHYLETIDPNNTFFDFEIDPNLTNRVKLTVMYSTDDDDAIVDTIKLLKEKLPNADYIEFKNSGHFTTEPGYNKNQFPELLNKCIK